jgi:hypothetical protein
MKTATRRASAATRPLPLSETQLEHVRGGAAPSNSISEDSQTEVLNNPLFQGAGTDGMNPLFEA